MVVITVPPQDKPFSYASAGAGWMNGSRTIFRVLDKTSGKELGTYSSPSSWFSWHHINCWENATHISMDITWVPNGQSILKGMSGQLLPFDWEGKLVRLVMPNPTADKPTSTTDSSERPTGSDDHRPNRPTGSDNDRPGEEGGVRLDQWDGWPRWASPEFGVVNPYHMYGRNPTRYMWYAIGCRIFHQNLTCLVGPF